ncbi:MAG: TnpV protein [Ruminococcaceae bacterium]|nr:TnpV protein [Oscillospiraceae bacterium]
MEKYITDEKNGLKYELVGDYYYPCLEAPEAPKVGSFGMMYHEYLRNHKRVTYSDLLLSGKLKEHIEEIDRQAEEMFSQLVEEMKQVEGITELLKAKDQMEWVRRMNNIRNRAEEIVESEVVFA